MRHTAKIAFLVLMVFQAACAEARTLYSVKDVRFVDGDTLWLGDEKIRLESIDTPEPSKFGNAECRREALIGDKASLFVEETVNASSRIRLERVGEDRFGRTLGHVFVDGDDLAELLIDEGLAVRWAGRQHDWCKR